MVSSYHVAFSKVQSEFFLKLLLLVGVRKSYIAVF